MQPQQNQAAPAGSRPGTQPGQPPRGAHPPANPNSTQNTLQITAIRDGVVIMNDGSFRAVVMAKSINFDLMSTGEQEAVEYAYQNFLNSLYFDVQIFIRSRKIDMGPYLEKLGKIRNEMDNMLLGMLMEDYIYFIEDLVHQTNIMSKEFYLVIPYFSNVNAKQALASSKKLFSGVFGEKNKTVVTVDEEALEKAKAELKNRVQAVVNGLLQMGVQAIPLDTQELIELYYNAYNPDTATRQTLKQADQLTVPLVTKGEGHAPIPNIGGTQI
jgi:type IV secretory pathway VirB4 component